MPTFWARGSTFYSLINLESHLNSETVPDFLLTWANVNQDLDFVFQITRAPAFRESSIFMSLVLQLSNTEIIIARLIDQT